MADRRTWRRDGQRATAAGEARRGRWPSWPGRRSGRRDEAGAQSLEWIALGSFVATIMGGATLWAQSHGGELGSLLLNHIRGVLSQ